MSPVRTLAAHRTRLAVALAIPALLAVAAAVLLPRAGPASANPLTGIASVDASELHTCAVTTAGGVKCWGSAYGSIPVAVPGLSSGVAAVAAGSLHTCALTTAGGVKCWGENFGNTPTDVPGATAGITAIAAGFLHSCALTASGGVKCWGSGGSGQLGNGTNTPYSASAVDVVGLTSGVTAIAAWNDHTCALTTSGGVKCWGRNLDGELGDGTLTNRNSPVDVASLTGGVTIIDAGTYFTCAVTVAGAVKCWGQGFATTPQEVAGLGSGVTALAAGGFHICVITGAGSVQCRGANNFGQLGDGQTCGLTCSAPVKVLGLSGNAAALSGGHLHTCAVATAGGVKCWGRNDEGQLGDGTTMQRTVPFDVVQQDVKPTPTNTPCPPEGCPTPTSTPTPPPQTGLDFSLSVDTDGDTVDNCTTRGGPTKCTISVGERFMLNVSLNSLPVGVPDYTGFDVFLTYAGLGSKDNVAFPGPDCAFTGRFFAPGQLRFACVAGIGVNSTYIGVIATNEFNCTAPGTITMVHGADNEDTFIHVPPLSVNYAEGEGTTESLQINCSTPTPTPTPPPALGGAAQYPDLSSGRGAGLLAGVVAAGAGAVALGGAAWYARRRRVP